MIRDLRTILEGWDFEPGKISVRKIIGCDGREKIQTRIDLGVLQLECAGRPDGARPHGYPCLLDYHDERLRRHTETAGDDDDFVLSSEDCRALRHEAYLYYQRYLSLFVLEEFDGVERDTARNLRVIDLCARYGATEQDRTLLQQQRGYVLMMHTRACAYLALARKQPDAALTLVEKGLADLEALCGGDGEERWANEISTLETLRREVLEKLPDNAPVKLKSELEWAVAMEDYERATELRDRLERTRSEG